MNKNIVIILVLLAVGLFGLSYYMQQAKLPKNLTSFAECLKEKKTIFYGAFWCPHCQAQKKLFGDAVDSLPYVECSTPDTQGQLPVCTTAGVKSYPTWKFADGSIETGEVTLEKLAEKTGCSMPNNTNNIAPVGTTTTPVATSTAAATTTQ